MSGLGLEGRGAMVAGGAGGIGRVVCAQLFAAGARVAVLDRPGQEAPPGIEFVACDLTRADDVGAGVAAAHAVLGRLDVVVHCAGITRDALLTKMADDAWHAVIAANLHSAFYLLRAVGPLLWTGGGGAVVLVSSINGERGKAGQANYAASKAGLIALGRTAAREWGRHHVRVNVVAPGWTDTPMTDGLPGGLRQRAIDESALGAVGQPADVADAVVFLCSDRSRHVTGQVLRVDGGQLIA